MRLKEFTNTVANWKTIAARNKLANPDLIMPGQVLDIGDGVVMPKGTTYTVKPGYAKKVCSEVLGDMGADRGYEFWTEVNDEIDNYNGE